jgi:hypothetical protein
MEQGRHSINTFDLKLIGQWSWAPQHVGTGPVRAVAPTSSSADFPRRPLLGWETAILDALNAKQYGKSG